MNISEIRDMIKELAKTYSQSELSSQMNVPQGTISKILNGKQSGVHLSTANKISDFYKKTVKKKHQKTPSGN